MQFVGFFLSMVQLLTLPLMITAVNGWTAVNLTAHFIKILLSSFLLISTSGNYKDQNFGELATIQQLGILIKNVYNLHGIMSIHNFIKAGNYDVNVYIISCSYGGNLLIR